MKLPMVMMVAGVAIVFAAPIANARAVKSHHNTPAVHKIAKSKKASKASKAGTETAKPPIYIYIPGFTGTPAATPDTTDPCAAYMVDCTDQQLCETWGENCSTANGQSGDAQPAASDTSNADAPIATQVGEISVPAASSDDATQSVSTAVMGATATAVDDSSADC